MRKNYLMIKEAQLRLLSIIKRSKSFIKNKELVFPASTLEGVIRSKFRQILILTMDRTARLKGRAQIGSNFITYIFKMNKHHGPTTTVKWLKACSVCLQKFVGGDRILNLRVIEPNLPLHSLANGLPKIIIKGDRQLIRKGDIHVIRF